MGLGLPDRLADGAAKATPLSLITCCTTGWEGIRTPTVSNPAQVTSLTSSPRGITIVSGPGQKAAASFLARSGTSDTMPLSISIP